MKNVSTLLGLIATALSGASFGCEALLPESSCGDMADPADVEVSPEVACKVAKSRAACREICPSPRHSCTLPAEYEKAFADANPAASSASAEAVCPAYTASVVVRCAEFCEGRTTDGVSLPAHFDPSLAGYFATCAALEHAAVFAFQRLARELRGLGAPRELVARARRAARDEIAHVRITAALARHFGGAPVLARPEPLALRDAAEIALENAREGQVRETWGALLASLRARHAADPAVRVAMDRIARDELGHAQLSWDVAAWLDSRIDDGARQAVSLERERALADLGRSVRSARREEPRSFAHAVGMPSPAAREAALGLLEAQLFDRAA